MRKSAVWTAPFLCCILLVPIVARADHQVFLGWSKSNDYSVFLVQEDGKDLELGFCSNKSKPSWPAAIGYSPRRAGCVYLPLPNQVIDLRHAKRLVRTTSSRTGPHGETVSIRFVDKENGWSRVIGILHHGNQKLEIDTGQSVLTNDQKSKTKVSEVFWRTDGQQVAFYIDIDPASTTAPRWVFAWDYAADLAAMRAAEGASTKSK